MIQNLRAPADGRYPVLLYVRFTGDDVLAFFLIKVGCTFDRQLSDSVAPEVKTISRGSAPTNRQSDYGRYLPLLQPASRNGRTGGRVTKGSVHRHKLHHFLATRGSTGVVAE